MALDNFRRIDMQINRANDYQLETQFAKEGDYNGRELVVQITNAGEVSDQNGVSLNLGWRHDSAGNTGLDPFTIVDASKGIFKITYPTEMLIAGDVTASIQVIESGKITLTRNFKITVENNPIDEGAIVSENSFTALTEALVKVNDLEDNYAPRLNEVTAQLAHTVQSFRDENGSEVNNYPIPNNFALDGVQRSKSTLNLSNEGLSTFDVNTNVYRLSNFTLWGKNRTGKGIDASGAEDNNTNATIDNVYFNSFDVCIDTRSAYLNATRNSKFQNSNKGIRILNDSYSNLIDFNSFLAVDNPIDLFGTNGLLATNTLRFINNAVESYNVAVKNRTEMYIDKTYFGDNNGSGYARTGEVDKLIQSFSESSTYINDSWLGMVSRDYSELGLTTQDDTIFGGIIDFQTEDSLKPTTVRIENSDVYIAGQNAGGKRYGFIYKSRSKLDRVILNNVKMRIATNRVHNVVPFFLEKDYSPLYSTSPMKNYVINGTFTDDDLTNYYLNSNLTTESVDTSIVPDVTNQYGGKVIRFDGNAWTNFTGMSFVYRVPKHLIGKPLALEVYAPHAKMDGSQVGVKYTAEGSDLLSYTSRVNDPILSLPSDRTVGSQTPYRNIFIVIPTKEMGNIKIGALYSQPQDVFCEISSITLSDIKNYELVGQYEDYQPSEVLKCTTSNRPTIPILNQEVYDTTIKKTIWWDGSVWVDVTGVTV